MKAVLYHTYGSPDVLKLQEVDTPNIDDDDVLVRVRASSVNPADWHTMRGAPYIMRLAGTGVRKPRARALGGDLAGVIDAIGRNVTRFRVGDEVFAIGTGAFAEYARVPEKSLVRRSPNLTFEQAAAVPLAATTALQGLRNAGGLQPGQKVLVVGASGGVGTFAVQIAKALGAEVTGVCSTRNVELVRSLGADHVIDYTQEDFTRSERKYDLILQVAGTASPAACRRVLTPKGTLVLVSGDSKGRWIGPIDRVIKAMVLSRFVSQKLTPFLAKSSAEDLVYLKELIEDGKVTPVIDRTYPLSEISDAIRYLEERHARGKVVITVDDNIDA